MFTSLKGYRTYIFAVLIGIIATLEYLGIVTPETKNVLVGLFGMGSIASLRAAMK